MDRCFYKVYERFSLLLLSSWCTVPLLVQFTYYTNNNTLYLYKTFELFWTLIGLSYLKRLTCRIFPFTNWCTVSMWLFISRPGIMASYCLVISRWLPGNQWLIFTSNYCQSYQYSKLCLRHIQSWRTYFTIHSTFYQQFSVHFVRCATCLKCRNVEKHQR